MDSLGGPHLGGGRDHLQCDSFHQRQTDGNQSISLLDMPLWTPLMNVLNSYFMTVDMQICLHVAGLQ